MKLKTLTIVTTVSLLSACSWWNAPNRYGVSPSVWDSLSPEQQQLIASAHNEDSHLNSDLASHTISHQNRKLVRHSTRPKTSYTVMPDGRKRWSVTK